MPTFLNMDIGSVYREYVDLFMPRKTGFHESLLFYAGFDIHMLYKDQTERWTIHLIAHPSRRAFFVHFGTGLVNVDEVWQGSWTFASSHDTCWCDAIEGYINQIYLDAMKRLGTDRSTDIHKTVYIPYFGKPQFLRGNVVKQNNVLFELTSYEIVLDKPISPLDPIRHHSLIYKS